jgi:TetR/AcrR family transcriptional repressor of nem operon
MRNPSDPRAGGDVRQHILDTGKALILGKGFTAVGLAELLGAAGVPKGSFYYYFASKEQFGEALLESYFRAYLKALDDRLGAAGTPARDRLLGYFQRWLSIHEQGLCHEQCLVVKLGAEVSDLSEPMRAALHRGTDGIISRLSECLAEAVADGSVPTGVPDSLMESLYEFWLGASLLAKIRREASPLASAMAATRRLLGAP